MCFFRAFLMGGTANFLNLAFPVKHFGKVKYVCASGGINTVQLYGITRLSGGCVTMLAVPIFNYVQSIGNKFEYANAGFAIAMGKCRSLVQSASISLGVTAIHFLNVWRTANQRAKNQNEKSAQNYEEGFLNSDNSFGSKVLNSKQRLNFEPMESYHSINA